MGLLYVIGAILNIIVCLLIILLAAWILYDKIMETKNLNKIKNKINKNKFSVYKLSDFVNRPLKCNVLPYRPGCCNLAQCRQPGSQIDQFGKLQVYINPIDSLGNVVNNYYDESEGNINGDVFNQSVNEFGDQNDNIY